MSADITLHLVLTFHWFDETAAGRKPIEYRTMTTVPKKGPNKGRRIPSRWMREIWDRRDRITAVRFARGYTSNVLPARAVTLIDIGPCPIPGWSGDFIRIHSANP
jgi:hypothetical protein